MSSKKRNWYEPPELGSDVKDYEIYDPERKIYIIVDPNNGMNKAPEKTGAEKIYDD